MRIVTLALMLALGSIDVFAQGRRNMRFAAMDADGDGVITRQEWRGTARSFRTHDWNGDGVLSGDEVRPGARRQGPDRNEPEFESSEREHDFADWTPRGFTELDHNRDGRISRDEWHFDLEGFRRADHNRDGSLSRAEFLGDAAVDDDREDRFADLDANGDGRVSRAEWHGTAERFESLDDNRDGLLTRAEMRGTTEPPADLFTSVDVDRNNAITRDEWHWSRASFDRRDRNRDGRLTREEFTGAAAKPTQAWQRGHDRGVEEGRQAGKEDRAATWGWDLEGQRELEEADSGYEPGFGSRAEYQAGYREGFRKGYREGFGPR